MPTDAEIEDKWVDEAKQLWTIQEQLLQNYRSYLIVLNSLLAAGSCALIGRLTTEIHEPKSFALLAVVLLILLAFICFGFLSLRFMIPVIRNRGYNVHLCQFLWMKLTTHQLLSDIRKKFKEEFSQDFFKNVSLLAAFKMAEHPKEHPGQSGFLEFCKKNPHYYLGRYLRDIKDVECKDQFDNFDHARTHVNALLLVMFLCIWSLILSFLAAFLFIVFSTARIRFS